MGKKSLIKSTTKKKSSAKKGESKAAKKQVKKTTKKAAPKSTKKAAAKTTKKAAPKKAAPKKTAAKKTTEAKSKVAPKKTTKKVSIKTLVFKKFEALQAAPEQMAAPKTVVSNISAPPLIDSTDPKEVERIRALLFNKFDMDDIKAVAKEPEPTPAPKTAKKAAPIETKPPKKVSIKELIFKKFETSETAPVQMAAPKTVSSSISAPPLIDSTDPKEVERLKALLFNKYGMNEIKAAAKEPAALPDPKIEKPAPAVAAQAEDNAYITVEPTEQNGGTTTLSLPIKLAIAVAATVVFLMLAISYNNGSKYYIQPKDNAIEIWKGRFSPKDTKFFMALDGVELPEPVKEIYTKAEVFPLILDYYVNKADTLLEVPGLPDFQGIKDHLVQAEDFIVTPEAKTAVTSRLNNIEKMILLYKADVAISKNTEDSLESAIKLLKNAAKLTSSTAMSEEISQKIDGAREQIVTLEAEAKQQAEEMKAAQEAEKMKAAQEAEEMKAAQEERAEELKAAPEKDTKAPVAPEQNTH